MRVYISVDMEGVAGVVHEDQTDPVDPRYAGEYNRFRRLMTAEANAAIEGALAAGAGSVLPREVTEEAGDPRLVNREPVVDTRPQRGRNRVRVLTEAAGGIAVAPATALLERPWQIIGAGAGQL